MLLDVIIFLIPYTYAAVHMNIPELNSEINKNETRLHLKDLRVQRYCRSRRRVCASTDARVCTTRYIRGEFVYKDFENSCFLFLANMCDHPGEEFHIVSGTTCEDLSSRRHGLALPAADHNSTTAERTTARAGLRVAAAPTTMSTIYDIDTAFDEHKCPLSCPDTYNPVCVCANRNWGVYYKFFSFSNHCEGDRYYCKHWEELGPPPGEGEKVESSYLGWSYCGSSRYLMFARFAESSASLGHYGWLHGNQRYSHIMHPNERQPGYG